MAALVALFYQFAGDVDEGKVTKVSFESPAAEERKKRSVKVSRAATRRRSYFGTAQMKTIEMYCADNEYVRTAIFVDSSEFELKGPEVVQTLLKEFCKEHKAALDELKPKFQEAAKSPEQALSDLKFLPRFATFGDTIEKLGYSYKKKAAPAPISERKDDDAIGDDDVSLSYQ